MLHCFKSHKFNCKCFTVKKEYHQVPNLCCDLGNIPYLTFFGEWKFILKKENIAHADKKIYNLLYMYMLK